MTMSAEADEPVTRRPAESMLLLKQLMSGVEKYQMRRATWVLGFSRDGYWLRRFMEDPALRGVVEPGTLPVRVNWDGVVGLLDEAPALLGDDTLEPDMMGPYLAALEISVSLAAGRPVDLRRAAKVLTSAEWQRVLFMEPAGDFI
ncbi:hypothetical protein ACLF6K_06800 [Streptomyces xanthophaeus]|uniref:hypothetical protein n=1 Tax=Streptomyces xanthophaeus TaxID=67385 RepID=UPI00398FA2BB